MKRKLSQKRVQERFHPTGLVSGVFFRTWTDLAWNISTVYKRVCFIGRPFQPYPVTTVKPLRNDGRLTANRAARAGGA